MQEAVHSLTHHMNDTFSAVAPCPDSKQNWQFSVWLTLSSTILQDTRQISQSTPALHTHLSFHLDIIVIQQPKEFMRGVWVFPKLVSTVATLPHCPHCHTFRKPQANAHYINIDQTHNAQFSLPGMLAYALNRLFALGCGKIDAFFFWVSSILLVPRSTKWHTDSYCYLTLKQDHSAKD